VLVNDASQAHLAESMSTHQYSGYFVGGVVELVADSTLKITVFMVQLIHWIEQVYNYKIRISSILSININYQLSDINEQLHDAR